MHYFPTILTIITVFLQKTNRADETDIASANPPPKMQRPYYIVLFCQI